MDFKQLESFIAVAETRSMTEAARRRQLTQSAVSHQIKAIERELGSKLFIRHSNVLVLTEDGADFLAATREMFRKIQEGLDKIETLKGRVSGVLRVGVGSFIEPYARRAGCQMMKNYPDLRFEVIIEKDHVLNEMLRAHKIDMAFTIRNSRSDENIESMPIVPIQIRAVVGESHPLAKKEKVTFEELKQHSVVMPEEDARSFAVIEKIIGQDLRDLHSRVSINSADAAFATAIQMGWVTFATPAHVMGRDDLVTIQIDGLEKEIWGNAHWMRDMYLKNSARKLIEILKGKKG